MRGDGIVIKRTGVADVHVRIDEPGNEEAIMAVNARGMAASGETGCNLRDAAVANHHGDTRHWRRAFGRDESNVLDDEAVVDDLARGGAGRGSKSERE
jgi:hypothetical protein